MVAAIALCNGFLARADLVKLLEAMTAAAVEDDLKGER
jgi:hypothetical protein